MRYTAMNKEQSRKTPTLKLPVSFFSYISFLSWSGILKYEKILLFQKNYNMEETIWNKLTVFKPTLWSCILLKNEK